MKWDRVEILWILMIKRRRIEWDEKLLRTKNKVEQWVKRDEWPLKIIVGSIRGK